MKTAFVLAIVLVGAAGAADAQATDARWTPWLGCWQLVDGDAQVCMSPAPDGGVVSRTIVDGNAVLDQTIVPDGQAHPLDEAGCPGSQRAEWSRDGDRLFVSAALNCAGQQARRVTGIATIAPDQTWVDVQAVEVGGLTTVRVRRYRRDGPNPAESLGFASPYAGGARWSLDDVKEASGKVSAEALEATIAETGARFDLDGQALIDLDDAGVDGSVIDLMVAQSYPERFQIERRQQRSPGPAGYAYPVGAEYPGYYGSYPYYYGSDPYYYTPFGYGLYGPYSYYYYYPRGVAVGGGGVDSPSGGDEVDEGGRAVNGVGYTRVRTRRAAEAEAAREAGGSSESGSTASPSGYTRSSGSLDTSSSGSSGGSSGAGSAPSGGSSSGGRTDTGRTAQPR